MVALVSEEEADAKRNMEEKLLHLGASVGGLGMADLASRNSLDCEQQLYEEHDRQHTMYRILLVCSSVDNNSCNCISVTVT
ncbi:hypothetical protein ACFX2K_017453 [Malus domestica]